MSYIFSGLTRKNTVTSEEQSFTYSTDKNEYKPKVEYDKALKCFVLGKDEKKYNFIKLNVETDDWEDYTDTLWSHIETFLLNSVKVEYLKNVVNHVPKLFYMFRPSYSVQLAIRYIIKNISGVTSKKALSYIIMGNNELLGYFVQFYLLCREVYTGQFVINIRSYDKKFVRGFLLSLIELINLLRDDTPELLRVSPNQLTNWGDDSILISNTDVSEDKESVISRGKFYDPDMNTIDRFCVVCGQYFTDAKTLLAHIRNHDQFTCIGCNIEVGCYRDLVCHTVTFCRSTKWNTDCAYCNNQKTNCACAKITELCIEVLIRFTDSQAKNSIFENDMLSTLTHYYSVHNTFVPNLSIEQTCELLAKEVEEHKPVTLGEALTSEEIFDNLKPFLPDIIIDRDVITCKGLAVSTTWPEIKHVLQSFFNSYHEAELTIVQKLCGLRTFCLFKNCSKSYSMFHHIEVHAICLFARSLTTVELPVRQSSLEKFTRHSYEHVIDMGQEKKLNCIYCDFVIDTHDGINLGGFLAHAASHLDDKQQLFDSVCTVPEVPECKKIKLISAMDVFFHKLLWHVKDEGSLRLYIQDMSYEEGIKKSIKGNLSGIKTDKKFNVTKRITYGSSEEIDQSPSKLQKQHRSLSRLGRMHSNLGESNSNKSSDDEDEDDDKDDGDRNIHLRSSAFIGDNFYCRNEKHEKPFHFSTKVALQKHIIENHTCSFKNCTFSAMMESTLLLHYEIHLKDKMEAKCTICNKIVKDLDVHRNEHPRCKSCKVRFENLAILRVHEPTCKKIKQDEIQCTNEVTVSTTSLNVDTTDLESKFSSLIQKLLHDSNLTSAEKTMGAQIIEKYTSSNALAKNRSRIDAINNRRNDALLFDVPNFQHQDKPQLHKVLSSCGEIKVDDKFNPSIHNSNQNCVINFEVFEMLLKKVESLVLLGNLTEILSVALLQRFIGQQVIDAVTSYQQKNWEELSFQSILESIQWIYIPLKLSVFQTYVLSYKHDKTIESFLEFSSKVYRHLKLCARLKPRDDRIQYIEQNQRKILKRNLPLKLLDAIEAKESLYTAFTSKEIIDHYVSWVHNQTEGRNEQNKYNVFTTRVKPVPATIRNKQPQQSRFSKRSPKENSGSLVDKGNDKNNRVCEVKPKTNGINKIPRIPSEVSKQKLNKLKSMGIDVTYPICFLCLNKHSIYHCKQYKNVTVSDKLCTQIENNKEIPMGYHSECRHHNNTFQKYSSENSKNGQPKVTVWRPRNK